MCEDLGILLCMCESSGSVGGELIQIEGDYSKENYNNQAWIEQ